MVHPFFERKERKKSNENALCGAYLNHHWRSLQVIQRSYYRKIIFPMMDQCISWSLKMKNLIGWEAFYIVLHVCVHTFVLFTCMSVSVSCIHEKKAALLCSFWFPALTPYIFHLSKAQSSNETRSVPNIHIYTLIFFWPICFHCFFELKRWLWLLGDCIYDGHEAYYSIIDQISCNFFPFIEIYEFSLIIYIKIRVLYIELQH